jgi:GcrA cell cycle regulator
MGQLVNGGWTTQESDALCEFVLSGLSYAQSAFRINEEFGTHYTRNGAIGRAHRIGLSAPIKLKEPPKKRNQPYKPRRRVEKRALPPEAGPLHLTLLELEADDCRFPYGDGCQPYLFCGHAALEGSSYCRLHMNLCTRSDRKTSEVEG